MNGGCWIARNPETREGFILPPAPKRRDMSFLAGTEIDLHETLERIVNHRHFRCIPGILILSKCSCSVGAVRFGVRPPSVSGFQVYSLSWRASQAVDCFGMHRWCDYGVFRKGGLINMFWSGSGLVDWSMEHHGISLSATRSTLMVCIKASRLV